MFRPVSIFLVFLASFLVLRLIRTEEILSPIKIIKENGYPVEEHLVKTKDNYILTIHRIPHNYKNANRTNKIPVFLMHGLTGNSADFVIRAAPHGLGYILADNNYDVWLGNTRGNSLSNKHVFLDKNVNPKAYYNFSWHEIGIYDLPASIDYILNVTGQEKLHYIGYSQGSSVYYVMASSLPEYNRKIRTASLMAQSAIMKNCPHPSTPVLGRFIFLIERLTNFFHIYNLPVHTIRSVALNYCNRPWFRYLCLQFYFQFVNGFEDFDQILDNFLADTFKVSPDTAALKQLYHYAQIIRSGFFRQYDYGKVKNLQVYGSKEPPIYNLTAISAPVALYYGANDIHVNVKDIDEVSTILPNVINKYLVPYEKFNHIDHIWAKDIVKLEYNEIVRVLNEN